MDEQNANKPDIVDMAKKKRHIKILEKIRNPQDVPSKSEVKELAQYEAKKLPEGEVEGEEQVAQIFGVSVRSVQYWKREGMPVLRNGHYRISDIKAWRTLKNSKNKKKDKKLIDWDEEWRKERALRERRLNREREGELLQKSDIEQSLIDLFSVIKTKILSIPRGLSPQLQGLDARQIEIILDTRIKETISAISTGQIFISIKEKSQKNVRKNKKT